MTAGHLDSSRSVDERVELLLAQMTVREKAHQLTAGRVEVEDV